MKSYTNYFEKDRKFFKQNMNWWDKGSYYIPQTVKRITKEEYEKQTKINKS